jgi:hypothetical protein
LQLFFFLIFFVGKHNLYIYGLEPESPSTPFLQIRCHLVQRHGPENLVFIDVKEIYILRLIKAIWTEGQNLNPFHSLQSKCNFKTGSKRITITDAQIMQTI